MDDIRGAKEIFTLSDYYELLFTLFGVIVFLVLLGYFLRRFFKKENIREEWVKKIESVDLSDTKKASYEITKYGELLMRESKNKEVYNALLQMLAHYKYKKEVPKEFDGKTVGYYRNFVESLDG